MSRLTNLLLIGAIVACSWTIGLAMGINSGDGMNNLAKANEKIAASYDRLAEQLARVKSD